MGVGVPSDYLAPLRRGLRTGALQNDLEGWLSGFGGCCLPGAVVVPILFGMSAAAAPFRALIMPVAFVGLAMAAPEGWAVSAPVAEQVVEHTVGRAEAITGQISEAVRQLCQSDDLAPTFWANVVTGGRLIPESHLTGEVVELCHSLASLLTPAPRLIDLPPPTIC